MSDEEEYELDEDQLSLEDVDKAATATEPVPAKSVGTAKKVVGSIFNELDLLVPILPALKEGTYPEPLARDLLKRLGIEWYSGMGTKTMQNIAYYILLNTEVVGQLMDRYDMIGRPRSFVALADELIENERDITDNLDLGRPEDQLTANPKIALISRWKGDKKPKPKPKPVQKRPVRSVEDDEKSYEGEKFVCPHCGMNFPNNFKCVKHVGNCKPKKKKPSEGAPVELPPRGSGRAIKRPRNYSDEEEEAQRAPKKAKKETPPPSTKAQKKRRSDESDESEARLRKKANNLPMDAMVAESPASILLPPPSHMSTAAPDLSLMITVPKPTPEMLPVSKPPSVTPNSHLLAEIAKRVKSGDVARAVPSGTTTSSLATAGIGRLSSSMLRQPSVCSVCQNSFSSESALALHFLDQHANVSPMAVIAKPPAAPQQPTQQLTPQLPAPFQAQSQTQPQAQPKSQVQAQPQAQSSQLLSVNQNPNLQPNPYLPPLSAAAPPSSSSTPSSNSGSGATAPLPQGNLNDAAMLQMMMMLKASPNPMQIRLQIAMMEQFLQQQQQMQQLQQQAQQGQQGQQSQQPQQPQQAQLPPQSQQSQQLHQSQQGIPQLPPQLSTSSSAQQAPDAASSLPSAAITPATPSQPQSQTLPQPQLLAQSPPASAQSTPSAAAGFPNNNVLSSFPPMMLPSRAMLPSVQLPSLSNPYSGLNPIMNPLIMQQMAAMNPYFNSLGTSTSSGNAFMPQAIGQTAPSDSAQQGNGAPASNGGTLSAASSDPTSISGR